MISMIIEFERLSIPKIWTNIGCGATQIDLGVNKTDFWKIVFTMVMFINCSKVINRPSNSFVLN